MQLIQNCTQHCPKDERRVAWGSILQIEVEDGLLMANRRPLEPVCPLCGEQIAWTAEEEEPRRTTAEAQKEQTAV